VSFCAQAEEVSCFAWASARHNHLLAIGTSRGGTLCFDTHLHSQQVHSISD